MILPFWKIFVNGRYSLMVVGIVIIVYIKVIEWVDTDHHVLLHIRVQSLLVSVMFLSFINLPTGWVLKIILLGLPWWRSGWESACQCRGHGVESRSGKIPYAAEQLGPWAAITEPTRLEPVLRNKRGRDNERPAHRDEEWPPLAATRESPLTETKTQHTHK